MYLYFFLPAILKYTLALRFDQPFSQELLNPTTQYYQEFSRNVSTAVSTPFSFSSQHQSFCRIGWRSDKRVTSTYVWLSWQSISHMVEFFYVLRRNGGERIWKVESNENMFDLSQKLTKIDPVIYDVYIVPQMKNWEKSFTRDPDYWVSSKLVTKDRSIHCTKPCRDYFPLDTQEKCGSKWKR